MGPLVCLHGTQYQNGRPRHREAQYLRPIPGRSKTPGICKLHARKASRTRRLGQPSLRPWLSGLQPIRRASGVGVCWTAHGNIAPPRSLLLVSESRLQSSGEGTAAGMQWRKSLTTGQNLSAVTDIRPVDTLGIRSKHSAATSPSMGVAADGPRKFRPRPTDDQRVETGYFGKMSILTLQYRRRRVGVLALRCAWRRSASRGQRAGCREALTSETDCSAVGPPAHAADNANPASDSLRLAGRGELRVPTIVRGRSRSDRASRTNQVSQR